MAKLVRRHTSNVEIVGSNPTGSIFLHAICVLVVNDASPKVSDFLFLVFFFSESLK